MPRDKATANDVYGRYGLAWADFPTPTTPSAHSDEAELFCAKLSMAVYGVYPSSPHSPEHDYIPAQIRNMVNIRAFDVDQMFEGGSGTHRIPFDSEQGYRVVVSDRASALLAWRRSHIIIAFRGTANWQDWIHNFTRGTVKPDQLSDSQCKLHKGFTGLAKNIAPAVEELLIEFLNQRGHKNDPPILTLCGHSLGGALALNFSARSHLVQLAKHRTPARSGQPFLRLGATYTFGTPRIGSGQIWNFIRRPHYRLGSVRKLCA